MANTSAVYARIDSGLKEDAEKILKKLGITPSGAIQMFYSQIVLTNGLPLDLHLRDTIPADDSEISEASERLLERNKAVYEELAK